MEKVIKIFRDNGYHNFNIIFLGKNSGVYPTGINARAGTVRSRDIAAKKGN